jgi:hypothetical protein
VNHDKGEVEYSRRISVEEWKRDMKMISFRKSNIYELEMKGFRFPNHRKSSDRMERVDR